MSALDVVLRVLLGMGVAAIVAAITTAASIWCAHRGSR